MSFNVIIINILTKSLKLKYDQKKKKRHFSSKDTSKFKSGSTIFIVRKEE